MQLIVEEKGVPNSANFNAALTVPHRHDATPELWQETYVSALLRSILYSDDPNYWLDAYRKLDPITSPDGEIRFLQAAEALFLKGTLLSCTRYLLLTRFIRLASWLRPRNPSRHCCVKSFNGGNHEVFRRQR